MFSINKVLIIRLSSIGDVLLTTPVIRILKKQYPSCQIDFVVKQEYEELLKYHPALRKIFLFDKKQGKAALRELKRDLKKENYDVVVDLHKNFRSVYLRTGIGAKKVFKYKKYIFKRWLLVNFKVNLYRQIIPVYQRYLNSLKEFKLEYDQEGLDLYFPPEMVHKMKERWNQQVKTKYRFLIGLAPGASFSTKRWTIEGYKEVAKYLIEELGAKILLFGSEADRTISDQIYTTAPDRILNVAGELSLLETAALMNGCQIVITNDTGLMHIAAALKKKIVAIFGSTTAELGFFPAADQAIVVQNNDLNCRPCSHIGRHECPKKHLKCMTEIKAPKVINAITALINANNA